MKFSFNHFTHSPSYEKSPFDLAVDDVFYRISSRGSLVFHLSFVAVRVDLRGL